MDISLYDDTHIEFSNEEEIHNAYLIRCVVHDAFLYASRKMCCAGDYLCDVFNLNRQCTSCLPLFCKNLQHSTGYIGQEQFWNRTPICKYVLYNADFGEYRKRKQCHFKKCGHVRETTSLFCHQHTCFKCLKSESVKNPFYRYILILYRIFPKDIVRYHIGPYLQGKIYIHKGKGHIVSFHDLIGMKLRGTCCSDCCPSRRIECRTNISSRCSKRICKCKKNKLSKGFVCKHCKLLLK